MSSLRKLAGETVIYGLSTVAGRFLNFLLVPFYTRVFQPDEYGVVTELYAYITFLLVVYTYGMETAFFRFASKETEPANTFSTAFYSLLGSSLIFSTALYFSADSIAALLNYQEQAWLLRWTALILFFDTVAIIPFAWLRYNKKALKFSLVKLGHVLFNISFNVLFLMVFPWLVGIYGTEIFSSFVYSEEIGPGYVFIANFLASALILVFLTREFSTIRPAFDYELWKKMVAFSMPLVVVGLAGMINEVSDRIMLRHLLPYEEELRMHYLGIYGACYKLSIFMTLGIQAFRYAAEPFFFQKARDADAPETYASLMNYFIAAGGLVFLSISLFLEPIKFVIDEAYHEGIHIVPILLLANLFLGIYYNTAVWYKLTNKTGAGAAIASTGAIITISGNFLLIPWIGYIGAAITTLICYVFMCIASWQWGKNYYPIPYDLKAISFILLTSVSILMAAEGFIYYQEPALVIAYLLRIAGLGIFLVCLSWLFNVKMADLKKAFRQVISKKKS